MLLKAKRSQILFVIIIVLAVFVYSAAGLKPKADSLALDFAATKSANSFTEAQQKDVESIIYNYLMENPEVIFDAVEKYRENEEKILAEQFLKKFGSYKHALINGPYSPSIGPDDADIVIIEFFDYNCGYCKKAIVDILALLKEDKKIKVVFKEMPVLSLASITAAEWSLAADKQGKYWEYHQKLMLHKGVKDLRTLETLAKTVGLDVEQLKKDAKDPVLKSAIVRNLEVSKDLGIRGTPAFIIEDFLAKGYMGTDAMRAKIRQIRGENG